MIAGAVAGGAAVDLAGTGVLVRVAARRERARLATWMAAVVALVVVTALSTKALYPTPADLREAAAAAEDNPAALAFNGPAQGLDTLGGQVAFQVGAFGLVVVGLMAILLVGRLTRAEEDTGRLELVLAQPVGRHAPLAAAVVLVGAVLVATGALVASGLLAVGLPLAGSLVLGASLSALGLCFGALTAVAAQAIENPRVVTGSAGAVLGAAFVVRAIGDVGDGTISWLSPIGWAQKARPFAGERPWALVLLLAAAVALTAAAGALSSRRDVGAGLLAPRPGPTGAGPGLLRRGGLVVRLQRGLVLWWAVAAGLLGAAYGSIAEDIEDFVADNEAVADLVARAGGASLTDGYLATSTQVLAILAAAAVVQAVLRLRTDELQGRTEVLLATASSRRALVGEHVLVVLVGSALVLAAGGLGVGLSYAVVAGEWAEVAPLVAAALVYLPAVWVLGGLAVAAFGGAPRWSTWAWAPLVACFVVAFLGAVLDLPSWLVRLSPFERTPRLPADGFAAGPVVGLAALAVGAVLAGMVAFSRRDV